METNDLRLWKKYVGDGICDDYFNTPECEFDGGDCCSPSLVIVSQSCWKCVCHNETTYTTTTPWDYGTLSPIFCDLSDYYFQVDIEDIGDGICDDNLNHEPCNYDGGDCCFGIKGVNCWICKCKDESTTSFPIITDLPMDGKLFFDKLKKPMMH